MNKPSNIRTILNCVEEGARLFADANLFYGHGTDNAEDEALWLVFHHLHLPWDSPSEILQTTVSSDDYMSIHLLFKRRIEERVPAAYLTGEAWFAGYPFIVNSDVLVPRSPIAELIASGFAPWLKKLNPRILDLCTGSGCIGIATALEIPESKVLLSDISPEALSVANQNIHRYQLNERVSLIHSDGFSAFDASLPEFQFDLIVSNPPYVDAVDFKHMPAEFQAEPELGLVSGEDGLTFTRSLLAQAEHYLNDDGLLIVEVGNSHQALEEAYPELPFMWFEFEYGGHGVFLLSKQDLIKHRALLV